MQRLVEGTITGQILQHMNHTEDLILNGPEACEYVYDTLQSMYDMLRGNTTQIRVSVKLDGAPAVIACSDYKGQMFVATKYAFNARTGELREDRVAHNEDELDNVTSNPEVKHKLSLLLKVLPLIDIPKDEIWGGDYLFENSDLERDIIDGTPCILFHPNTIVYAVPESDPLATKIKRSKFGIAWHTCYKGDDLQHLKVGFDVNISKVQEVPTIFQIDATMPSIAGVVTLTREESIEAEELLDNIRIHLDTLKSEDYYNNIVEDPQYVTYLNTYRNALIRQDKQMPTAAGFFEWLSGKYDATIASKTTTKSKEGWTIKKNLALNKVEEENLNYLYNTQNLIRILKEMFIDKLNNLTNLKTYLKYTDNHYQRANAEGYAISDINGNVQKFVSRLEFSKANFSKDIAKGWTSERRELESKIVKYSKLREADEAVVDKIDDLVQSLNNAIGTDNKKGRQPATITPRTTKVTYTLQPKQGDSEIRDIKQDKASDYLNTIGKDNRSFHLGRTPIIDFVEDDLVVRLQFKPRGTGAQDTEGDEVYWAYCMAAIQNNREELLPQTPEDVEDFDLTQLGLAPTRKAKSSNFRGYTEGSRMLCSMYLKPSTPYIFFRENTVIDNIGDGNYRSLHTLINKAARIVAGRGSKDTWNPSDIIACAVPTYDSFVREWEEEIANIEAKPASNRNFDTLNDILKRYLASKEVVGISLKDIGNGLIHVEEVNVNNDETSKSDYDITLDSVVCAPLKVRSEAKEFYGKVMSTGLALRLTCDGVGVILQYRLFGGPGMQAEAYEVGGAAKLGKCSINVIKDLYRKFGVRTEVLTVKDSESIMVAPETLSSKIQSIVNSGLPITMPGDPLSIETFEKFAKTTQPESEEDYRTYVMWPRIIDFLYLLSIVYNDPDKLSYVLQTLYKGAKKEFEYCAPFIKLW